MLNKVSDMRILRWISGISLKEKKRNEDIRKNLEVVSIREKCIENNL